MCLKKKAQPNTNLTQAALAKLYGIKEKYRCLYTILKNSSYWLTLDEGFSLTKRKRERIAAYPVIEEALYTWLEHANQVPQVISGHILSESSSFKTRYIFGRTTNSIQNIPLRTYYPSTTHTPFRTMQMIRHQKKSTFSVQS